MPGLLYCPACGGANDVASTHCFACQHLLSPDESQPAAPQDGTLLQGRYELGTCLGSGGYSLVYRARDLDKGGRVVAIKEISLKGLSATAAVDATETYHREARMLSSLNHPQVPRLFEQFGDRDHWYLVLNYIEGQTLETYLATQMKDGRLLLWEESIALILQLCTVLEYLHSRQPPMIFRDLKPGNIMRTANGTLHLIDFGIARHYQPGLARDTQRLGSPGYAAPEQYGRAQTTPQADIYSLGALLYFLLSGQDPAERGGTLPPLRLKAQAGSAELEQLVERLLSPDLSERPGSIREVTKVLRGIRDQRLSRGVAAFGNPAQPLQAPFAAGGGQQQQLYRPGQSAARASARITRRRALIGLGALTVVVGGGAWLLHGSDQLVSTTLPFLIPTRSVHPSVIYKGHTNLVNAVGWSPDGKRLASGSDDRTVQVWDALGGKQVFTYKKHTDLVNAVAWSPDGKQIASGSDDRTVQVWDVVGGGHAFTYKKHTDIVNAVTWSPDGKHIASGSDDKTVQVWDAVGGKHEFTYKKHTDFVDAVAWSPDSKRIASGSYDRTVQVWNVVDGGNEFTYQGHSDFVRGVAWSPDGKRIASVSSDNTVRVWNVVDGGNEFIYQGHSDIVNAVAWSPDGKRIASGSSDFTVQVWDAANGENSFTYHGHSQRITEVAWSPDGQRIASASDDTTVQVWDAP